MTIYEAVSVDGFELIQPEQQTDFFTLSEQLNGVPRSTRWTPIRMKLVGHCRVHGALQSADSPWLGSYALILKEHAVKKLKPFLNDYGELLPLICEGENIAVFNALRVLPALDEKASTILRFDSGKIMAIQRYVFHEDILTSADIFKLSNIKVSPIFFNESAKKIWESTGITGIQFEKISK